jgi:DNA-binding response OmpR family regulator
MNAVVALRPERITFDPSSGQLHHAGIVVRLPRRRANLLMLLVRAEGGILPPASVEALSRSYAGLEEAACRRRALIHNLRLQLRLLELEIETVQGFGYRLIGSLHVMPRGQAEMEV